MKFRHNKIKKEHSIIDGGLDWLEELSKKSEVTDIIPGVIDITHSKQQEIAYQYETPTGCKLLMKKGGAIQEVFVVTAKPAVVQAWVAKTMDQLSLFQAFLADDTMVSGREKQKQATGRVEEHNSSSRRGKRQKKQSPLNSQADETPLGQRNALLVGIKEDYQLVEINQGQRDSYVESLASMADLEGPKLEDTLEADIRQALEKLR